MGLLADTLDYMFPHSCLICGNVSDLRLCNCNICKSCISKINPEENSRRWQYCLSEPFVGDKYPKLPLYVSFPYQQSVVPLIRGLKFGGKKELGILIGMLLSKCMMSDSIVADLIIPIPLSEQRLKERTYNQAGVIASVCAMNLNIPYAEDVLVRNRNTNKQAECKSNEERYTNIMNAFSLNESWDISGLRIILVDDVVTTGNTMHEAATVLLDAGAKAVLCCAFAGNRFVKNGDIY